MHKRDKFIALIMIFAIAFTFLVATFIGTKQREQSQAQINQFKEQQSQSLTNVTKESEAVQSDMQSIQKKYIRNQVRSSLSGAQALLLDQFQDDQQLHGENLILDKDYRREVIERVVPTFASIIGPVGTTFVLNNDGVFEWSGTGMADIPTWTDHTPILEPTEREKTAADEVVWQDELKWLLNQYGLLPTIDASISKAAAKSLPNTELHKYQPDKVLQQATVFRSAQLDYLDDHYPDVIDKAYELRIITHRNYKQVESILENVLANPDGGSQHTEWKDPSSSDSFLIETISLPVGSLGFNQEPSIKHNTKNPEYLRLTLVTIISVDYINEIQEPATDRLNQLVTEDQIFTDKIQEEFDAFLKRLQMQTDMLLYITFFVAALSIAVGVYFFEKTPKRKQG